MGTLQTDLFYLHFRNRAGLGLGDSGGFVEGMYVEETAEGVELTFFCNEPSWMRMAVGSHAECLTTFSRWANLLILRGQSVDETATLNGFVGDLALVHGGPMNRVLEVANFCLSTICKPRCVDGENPADDTDVEDIVTTRIYH